MRITSLLLTLLLIFAPWSGAMAMAGDSDNAMDAPGISQLQHDMPCHGQPPAAEAPCDNCAQADCNLLDCEHCDNAVAGIPPSIVTAGAQALCNATANRQAASICAEPTPDPPPPIA